MYEEWHMISKNSSAGHLSRAPPPSELAMCTQTGHSQPAIRSKHWQTPVGGVQAGQRCAAFWGSGDTPPTPRPLNPTHCLTPLTHFPALLPPSQSCSFSLSYSTGTGPPPKPRPQPSPSIPASPPATPFSLEDGDASCTFLLFFLTASPKSLSTFSIVSLESPSKTPVRSCCPSAHRLTAPHTPGHSHSPQGPASRGPEASPQALQAITLAASEYPVSNPEISILITPKKTYPLASSGGHVKGHPL